MKKLVILFILGLWLQFASAQKSNSIEGIWWTEEKTSKIEIVEKDGEFFGTIVYIIPEKYENGQAPLDDKNPNPDLRSQSILGLQLLEGLSFNKKDGNWQGGRIYDAKSGKSYDCFGWFKEGNTDKLFLKGYVVGIKWLGKSTEWTRTSLN